MTSNTRISKIESVNDVESIVSELQDAFYDIPFENSNFQNLCFVVGSQVTPARAYRALGLKITNKIQALREAKYALLKEDIDIDELRHTIENSQDIYARRRAELDLAHKLENRPFTMKLINDAVAEVAYMYSMFKLMPKYTREEFENEEQKHFKLRLDRQDNGIVGHLESKLNMEHDVSNLIKSWQETRNNKLTTE